MRPGWILGGIVESVLTVKIQAKISNRDHPLRGTGTDQKSRRSEYLFPLDVGHAILGSLLFK